MVNCNPETVSTDYDTSDRLYFEPLTIEDVLAVVEREQPRRVVVAVRRPDAAASSRARSIAAGVPILGTQPDAIDLAEDRERFGALLDELGLRAPAWAIASDADEAAEAAARDRLPGARAAVLRARWPRDAHLLRRGDAARGAARDRLDIARRPLRRGRDRDRRRRGLATATTC